jgi:leader peptidase (prepilin peptidase)/N-methyltransferase
VPWSPRGPGEVLGPATSELGFEAPAGGSRVQAAAAAADKESRVMSTVAEIVGVAAAGAVFGSFLNVVVHRLPRGESLVSPGSHCPSCHAAVKPYDNVPVLAWVWLRGRCRACRARISARYPLVEALTAALCVAVIATRSSAVGIALGLLTVVVAVPVAAIDFEHHIIPNRITAPAALAAVALGAALDSSGEPKRLLAAAIAGGAFLLVALAVPKGMGMGDVKLAGLLGLLLGSSVAPAIAIALVAGVLVGIAVLSRRESGERHGAGVPFGPFLAVGAVTAVFCGHAILAAYLRHLT